MSEYLVACVQWWHRQHAARIDGYLRDLVPEIVEGERQVDCLLGVAVCARHRRLFPVLYHVIFKCFVPIIIIIRLNKCQIIIWCLG